MSTVSASGPRGSHSRAHLCATQVYGRLSVAFRGRGLGFVRSYNLGRKRGPFSLLLPGLWGWSSEGYNDRAIVLYKIIFRVWGRSARKARGHSSN